MINRLAATRYLVAQLTDEPVIASLGNAKFDLFTAQDRPQNFYMWNSMGLASSMGLGLALVRPQQKVIVLDGDGSLLMNLNSLTTAAARSPQNLIHVDFFSLAALKPHSGFCRPVLACVLRTPQLLPARGGRWRATCGYPRGVCSGVALRKS